MKSARALSLLLGLSILSLALSGCSFLLGDPYGDYLQKADKWLDLRDEFRAKAGLELNNLSGIHFSEGSFAGTTYRYLFIQGDFNDGSSRIRALGYDDMNLLLGFEAMPSPGALTAEPDLNGDIKIEGNSYYADALNLHSASLPVGTDGTWKWLIADSASTQNYMFHINSSGFFHVHDYSSAWVAGSAWPWTIRGAESWNLARMAKLDDGRVSLLFSQGGGDYSSVVAATFPSFAIFRADFMAAATDLLLCPDAAVSAQIDSFTPSGSYDSPAGIGAWITQDGLVSLSRKNNLFTLKRYPLGPGGSMDSYSMAGRYDDLLYFEPSGKYWYRFDRSSGRLFRLRTWWK
jgi:hypothetical protein